MDNFATNASSDNHLCQRIISRYLEFCTKCNVERGS